MKTKLQRAVDATLEKYDELLEIALDGGKPYFVSVGGCRFCLDYWCDQCPIAKIEGDDYCIPTIIRPLVEMRRSGHAVPAILAFMCYLHGFVEE